MADAFGLLGRKLGHSWSPQIHAMLGGGYGYGLFEVEPGALEEFLRTTPLAGMNVTIPYKKDVVSYCAALSDAAGRIGSVNTLVRTPDGWYGDNTDYTGFYHLVRSSGVDVCGKKALIFGTGGAYLAVRTALEDMGADPIVPISRSGPDNYGNLDRHRDAGILVNTTPLGMFPDTGVSPADLTQFPRCEGVFDIVYNPQRTALLLQAEALGIPHAGGLGMLVAQAWRSAEQFARRAIDPALIGRITAALSRQMSNVVLIGMPGCGKSAVGRALAAKLDRPFADADAQIERAAGMTIPDIFAKEGEEGFRKRETAVLAQLGKQSGTVLATGGGCVTRAGNHPLLHQNGTIVWLQRDLAKLPSAGRPLSQQNPAETLYAQRRDKYAAFADITVDNNGALADTVSQIMEALA